MAQVPFYPCYCCGKNPVVVYSKDGRFICGDCERKRDTSGSGRKDDGDKLRFDLLPIKPLQSVAGVFTYGAAKYDDRNWEKGIRWGRVYAAAQRHLTAWWDGEDTDPESKLSHLDHALACLMMLREYAETHRELDDRPRKQVADA